MTAAPFLRVRSVADKEANICSQQIVTDTDSYFTTRGKERRRRGKVPSTQFDMNKV